MPCLRLNGRNYTGGTTGKQWVHSGTVEPPSSLGDDNTLYVQYDSEGIVQVYCKIGGDWYPFPSGGTGPSTAHSMSQLLITEQTITNSTFEEVEEV